MKVELEPLPPSEAIEFFRSKGYAPRGRRFDYRDIWRAEHARSFVVAKAMQDDVLHEIRAALDRALVDGTTIEQFKKELRPKLEAFGWWGTRSEIDPLTGEAVEARLGSPHRLRVIFDTNMRTSYAAGRWARIQRTKGAFPYLEYTQIDRPSRREEHQRYDGLIRPVDDPVWQRIYPPNGWFCGCSVRQVNDRMLEREGKRVSDPLELEEEEWENRRTGEIEMVPKGVHPGFDTNPGAIWLDLDRAHREAAPRLNAVAKGVERGLIQEVRARGLRDHDESLALYDLDDGEITDWNRSTDSDDPESRSAVGLTGAMISAVNDRSRRMVAVHNHPNSSSFSPADLVTLARSPGLDTVVAVGHDGSIFRVRTRTPVALLEELEDVELIMRQLFQTAINRERLSVEDANALFAHVRMTILATRGRLTYGFALSGRAASTVERNAQLIELITDEIAGL